MPRPKLLLPALALAALTAVTAPAIAAGSPSPTASPTVSGSASASASAAASPSSAGPIGGPLLTGSGIVVDPDPGAPPLPPASQLLATTWLVANLTTGQILATQGPHVLERPASTLKVLTALTLIPKLDPAAEVTTTEADASAGGTMVGIVPGEKYTVKTLFTAMLVDSANDAATALATANGGVNTTIAEMNANARMLQADDTHAGSVDGLDAPAQFSSAYDLALIARAALTLPSFRKYIATTAYEMPEANGKHFQIQTHNLLLGVYPGTFGVKNGYTIEDEATYIGASTRHGQTLIVTMMHAYPDYAPTAEALLTWGFQAESKVTPVGQLVSPLVPKPTIAPAAPQAVRAAAVSVQSSSQTDTMHLVALAIGALAAALFASAVGLRIRVMRRRRRRLRRIR